MKIEKCFSKNFRFLLSRRQPCWLRSWYNKMGFKNIAFLKMVFFNMWKLRTSPLKISAYFFLLQPAILTLQLIYDIIKWGLFFFKKKFFCSSLIYQLHMLDKIMSRRLQLISVSQLIWKIAAHLYLQLTYLTAHILDKVPRPVIE